MLKIIPYNSKIKPDWRLLRHFVPRNDSIVGHGAPASRAMTGLKSNILCDFCTL
jgi:hypothetical protein